MRDLEEDCVCYVPKNFQPESLKKIQAALSIIADYQRQGLTLTLRQLYYQFVSKDWIPNTQASYNNLGALISDARLAGLIPWTALEDRGRNLMGLRTYDGPAHAVSTLKDGYRIDMWANQDWRPEVWVEKAALEGVIAGICNQHRVDFFATRGYNSQSEQWRAGRRLAGYIEKGQRPIIFHLGDHDPSGIDMTRDNRDRLSMFAGVPILVQRLALNYPQIEQYRPPPNPTKLTDSRATEYVNQYGEQSWELDALSPTVISNLIGDAIARIKNSERWEEMVEEETFDQRQLEEAIEAMGGFGDDDEE